MGSDRFIAMYGVKIDVPAEALESSEARWKVPARRAGLNTWSGRTTVGGVHYVVVGALVGDLGVEGREVQVTLTDEQHTELVRDTRKKLLQVESRASQRSISSLRHSTESHRREAGGAQARF
jgi:hypothetical protein